MKKNTKSFLSKIVDPIHSLVKDLEIGGLILLGVTVIALILANSSFGEAFLHIWHTEFEFHLGDFKMVMDLHILINDVLMTLFFIVVGGEIKREIVEGALSTKEKAILPIIAALGGMLFPAIFFTIFNYGLPTASGWGIPTATDIAFSLTIISLLGKRVPFSLKIFLAALAIADDLGAIVVIAIFYSNSLDWYHLFGGFVVIAILVGLNKGGVTNLKLYALFGIILWYFFFMAGIHPTIAGVIFAMCVPFTLNNYEELYQKQLKIVQDCVACLSDKTVTDKLVRGELIEKMQEESHKMEAPLHNVLVFLHPISNYFIMPLFAFANAGVIINTDAFGTLASPVSLGIITGLMLGKSTGITLTSWLAVKFKIAQIPDDVNWKYIYGMAWVAGIGFTMSMFVTQLAFSDKAIIDASKIAIILASTLSGIIGYTYLKFLNGK
jgi:NhaA family Na+:H+ antiporter